MMHPQLTDPRPAATADVMAGEFKIRRGAARLAMLALGAVIALPGCVTVNAPEDAIVIELNINITQEVILRLAEDAGNTIEENADIF